MQLFGDIFEGTNDVVYSHYIARNSADTGTINLLLGFSAVGMMLARGDIFL